MARITQPFPEAMNNLQEAIRAKGYVVSRVQRVDVGLMTRGWLPDCRLPPRVLRETCGDPRAVYFAEGDDTLALTTDPHKLGEFFNKPELLTRFGIWEKDVRAILDEVARNP